MGKVPKADREVRAVVRFAAWSGNVVPTSIQAGPDPPDVVASTSSGKLIAIEVTDYFADDDPAKGEGSGIMAAQSEQNEIAERAQALWDQDHSIPLIVHPFWSSTGVMGVNRKEAAELLCRVLEDLLRGRVRPEGHDDIETDEDWLLERDPTGALSRVSVVWGDAVTQPLWAGGFAAFIGSDPQKFQSLIERKGARRPSYAADFEEAWLLVNIGMEGFGEVSTTVANESYDLHGFDRVFFFDSTRDNCVEATSAQQAFLATAPEVAADTISSKLDVASAHD